MHKDYTITSEPLDSFSSAWPRVHSSLNWNCLFVLPAWVRAWWGSFSNNGVTPRLLVARRADEPIGIAPVMLHGSTACLMGSADVCDYLDLIVMSGREREFFTLFIDCLKQDGITTLVLGPVRADSVVLSGFVAFARDVNCDVKTEPEDVTFEMELPATWEDYLHALKGKQRHEVRRKLRRLHEAGPVNFRVVEDSTAVREACNTFLRLFRSNRADKAAFMTDQMALYFQTLAGDMAANGIVRLGFLELDGSPAAAVMCFVYNKTLYLYNSGYDGRFEALNVGLMSKIFSIKDAIIQGCTKYDFLKGSEMYKQRLGAQPVQLYRCHIELPS